MEERRDERSVGDLLGDLTKQMGLLVRQEVDLARTEIAGKAGRVSRNVALLVAGGALAYAGFLALMAALVFLLVDNGVDAWLAAILVGVVVAGVGAVLILRGRQALQEADLVPRRTIQTLKDDTEWAKDPTTPR
jgi:hypothetical protein